MGIPTLVRRHLYIETAPLDTEQCALVEWVDLHVKTDMLNISNRTQWTISYTPTDFQSDWLMGITVLSGFNTLRPRQNCSNFPDDIFKCIFFNENMWILLKISLNFVPKVWINNIPALVQRMAWCLPGIKPLSETMMVSLRMHICVNRPQWANMVKLLKDNKKNLSLYITKLSN